MLESSKYEHVVSKASKIRNKYGSASQACIKNMANPTWIITNLPKLSPGDIALLSEYNRDIHLRQEIVKYFDAIQV